MRILAGSILAVMVGGFEGAYAIDCSRASTPVEVAICSDPGVKAADDAMSQAYTAARAAASQEGRDHLKSSQRDWIERRDLACGAVTPVDLMCLLAMIEDRRRLLAAEPNYAEPGAPQFVGAIIHRAGGPQEFFVEILYPRLAPDSDPAFAPLDDLIEMVVLSDRATWEAPPDTSLPTDMVLEYDLGFQIAYAAPAFVSIRFEIYGYSGGAHGWSYASTANYVAASRRELAIADMLDEAGLRTVERFCAKQIRQLKRSWGYDEAEIATWVSDDAVASVTGDIRTWTFGPESVEIFFAAYTVGPYAEGPHYCWIENSRLAAIVLPGSPVPPR